MVSLWDLASQWNFTVGLIPLWFYIASTGVALPNVLEDKQIEIKYKGIAKIKCLLDGSLAILRTIRMASRTCHMVQAVTLK